MIEHAFARQYLAHNDNKKELAIGHCQLIIGLLQPDRKTIIKDFSLRQELLMALKNTHEKKQEIDAEYLNELCPIDAKKSTGVLFYEKVIEIIKTL